MTAQEDRQVKLWSVAEDGTRTPFPGTGVRIPLSPGIWAALDFRIKGPGPLTVSIGVRCQRDDMDRLPGLAVIPRAGNCASVEVRDRGPSEGTLGLFAVDEAELGGDMMGWLGRTTSGDPLGEALWGLDDRRPLSARRFEVEYGDLEVVEVSVERSPEAGVVFGLMSQPQRPFDPTKPFRTLSMILVLNAANLVSFCFNEVLVPRAF